MHMFNQKNLVPRLLATMLAVGGLHASAASAATFQYRHTLPGLAISPTAQAQQVSAEILVALTGGPALPAGEVNSPYSYDLKQLLSVTGDSSYNASKVSWELQSGQLPAGLSLGTEGVLSGIPTAKDAVGSSFQVKATYKSKSGQQAYTIIVNGVVLHVTQIAAGGSHTCALTTSGGVKCWGAGTNGQLGYNSIAQSLVPVDVYGLTSGVASITAGYSHTCAVTNSGGVKCWGLGGYGQLGNNSTTQSSVPVDVYNLASGVASVTAGYYHTCALTSSGGAKCWGYNYSGQLGNNSTTSSLIPVDVYGLTSDTVSVVAGYYHTCAVTTSGGAKCWGTNTLGHLGNNSTTQSKIPVDVYGLTSGVASLSGGFYHTCAMTTSGGAKCWGANNYGQLGNNSTTQSLVPVDVYGLTSGIASVKAGGTHTCAITTSGGAKCWGANSYGQLGNSSTAQSLIPVDVYSLTSGVSSISAGNNHTCAVTSVGGARCWGLGNSGQLGNYTKTNSSVPVEPTP